MVVRSQRSMRAVCAIVGSAVVLVVLAWPTASSARDLVVQSFDGTPIVAHFFPSAGRRPGERAPTVMVGTAYATRGATNPDDLRGDRIGIATIRNAGFNALTWDSRGFGGSGGWRSLIHLISRRATLKR
jgi:ABC-2 type transport system ATP-binding protein